VVIGHLITAQFGVATPKQSWRLQILQARSSITLTSLRTRTPLVEHSCTPQQVEWSSQIAFLEDLSSQRLPSSEGIREVRYSRSAVAYSPAKCQMTLTALPTPKMFKEASQHRSR
jgi:hypothetical protein